MTMLYFFRAGTTLACTTDRDGLVLPKQGRWRNWFAQPVSAKPRLGKERRGRVPRSVRGSPPELVEQACLREHDPGVKRGNAGEQ
jgi:hypothetical protein